jgi:hypothetical protein
MRLLVRTSPVSLREGEWKGGTHLNTRSRDPAHHAAGEQVSLEVIGIPSEIPLVAITVAADSDVQPFDEDTRDMRVGSVVVEGRMDGSVAPVPDPLPHSRTDIPTRRWKPAVHCPLSPVAVPRVEPQIHHRPTRHKNRFPKPGHRWALPAFWLLRCDTIRGGLLERR